MEDYTSVFIAAFIEYGRTNGRMLWGGHKELCLYLERVLNGIKDGKIEIGKIGDETFEQVLAAFPPPKWEHAMSNGSIHPANKPVAAIVELTRPLIKPGLTPDRKTVEEAAALIGLVRKAAPPSEPAEPAEPVSQAN
jgi:hypothetical protein